jgi:hypothetical protein
MLNLPAANAVGLLIMGCTAAGLLVIVLVIAITVLREFDAMLLVLQQGVLVTIAFHA